MPRRPRSAAASRPLLTSVLVTALGVALVALPAVGGAGSASAAGGYTQAPWRTLLNSTSSRVPHAWVSTVDGTRRAAPLPVASASPAGAVAITVDTLQRFQRIDGFGAALTDSSAELLMGLSPTARSTALHALFDPVTGAGIDLVRLPLGATDFSPTPYTYDDLVPGTIDLSLARLDLSPLDAAVVPVLREALAINPSLRVMATPWTAPAWMKSGGSLVGGTLAIGMTAVYAQYLTDTIAGMRTRGIPVDFLTLQNEPEHAPSDYPGMTLSPAQEAALAVALAPQLAADGLGDVTLIGYDHNWDDPSYALSLLAGKAVRAVLGGTAWHCYAGSPSAQTQVHASYPTEGIWVTECSGGTWSTDFGSNLGWDARNLTVGAMQNWSRSVLLWNLALDPRGGPHTGGCATCRGVLTIDPTTGSVTENVEWDTLALGGRHVEPGARRVASTSNPNGVQTVAYLNPDGSRALTAYNSGAATTVALSDGGHLMAVTLPAGSVAQLTW